MSDKRTFELSPSVSIVVAGVIIAAAIVFVHLTPSAPAAAQAQDTAGQQASVKIPALTAADHVVGSITAPIVLVEYSDFQCPYCQMVYPTIKQIVSQSNGQIAWVMREFPLTSIHPNALPAALAAECVSDELGNSAFWKFADAIFADQTKMNDAYYAQLAGQFGANSATFQSCYTSQKFLSKINQETADAENNGGQGTPYTVILNTKTGKEVPVSGAVPLQQFEAAIQEAQSS